MWLVLDTNIVASGLLWNGTPARLIDAAQADEVELCTSRILLVELARILQRAKFSNAISATGLSADELVMGYVELATLFMPMSILPTILRDPDNDHVLACALTAGADLIVSSDKHLLEIKSYQNDSHHHRSRGSEVTRGKCESLNMSLRKVSKNRGSFPSDEAVLKLFYLTLQNISKKWTMPIRDWKAAPNRLTIQFEDRMPQH